MIIRIKNIDVETVIGVYDWEKKKRQPLIINVKLEYNGKNAARSDDIKDAVDYIEIAKKIKDEVEKTSFELVEKLVDFVLDIVMRDNRIKKAKIEIDKPEALKGIADSVSVTGKRKR